MGSEELLLESGKSNELSAMLHTVAESEVDGEPKFSPAICRELGKMIVCRTYATPIMELCHLIVCASHLSTQNGRYEYLFWDSGAARGGNFQAYCTRMSEYNDTPDLCIDAHQISFDYPDGSFAIQYGRMPVLSALMEFLLTALGYCDIDDILQDMLSNRPTKKTVSQSANALSRLLYAYLRQHLPTAQSQRKFRKIMAYCGNDTDTIDDDLILHFWQDTSLEQEKGLDFKTFDSVLSTFIRAIQAVESARSLRAMQHAGSIGGDRENGEIDPDTLSETLDSIDETVSALVELTSPPLNSVKFLNKQESSNLEGILNAGGLALRLPLSILRNDIFSKPQSRLTQALRRHVSPAELNDLIIEEPQETYQDRQITYQSLRQQVERSVHASLYALLSARAREAISLMLKLKPGIDLSPLSRHLLDEESGDNVTALHSPRITERFMDILQHEDQVGAEIADLLQTAQEAYAKTARKGFKDEINDQPELSHTFATGAALMLDIARDIDAFLERLDSLKLAGGGWQAQYSLDHTVFKSQFNKIYTGA